MTPPAAELATLAPTGKWVCFRLDAEVLCIAVAEVQEVLMPQPLSPVPLAPPHVVGLLNLRGQVMSAVDLRLALGFSPRPPGAVGSLVVVRTLEGPFALVVDDIGDVIEVRGADWRPPPDTLAAAYRLSVFGVYPMDKALVLGLRTDAVLRDPAG